MTGRPKDRPLHLRPCNERLVPLAYGPWYEVDAVTIDAARYVYKACRAARMTPKDARIRVLLLIGSDPVR